jgi:hypothetical protein
MARQHRSDVIPLRKPVKAKSPMLPAVLFVAGVGFAGTYVVAAPEQISAVARTTVGQFGLWGCNIKGNISINSGEHIYHVPGQRHYDETIIRLEYGERYFCSEQEARAAGWRPSGI